MKSLTKTLEKLIEDKARELIAGMEVNIFLNGCEVDNVREDHNDRIDLLITMKDLEEVMGELDFNEPLTFKDTGCVRRFK